MLIDYVKAVTGRIFTMTDAQPAPAPAAAERRAIFDQVRFQHVISDRWSAENAEKVCGYTMLSFVLQADRSRTRSQNYLRKMARKRLRSPIRTDHYLWTMLPT